MNTILVQKIFLKKMETFLCAKWTTKEIVSHLKMDRPNLTDAYIWLCLSSSFTNHEMAVNIPKQYLLKTIKYN
jgi:hypothetical protein